MIHEKIWVRQVTSRGNDKSKGPEVGVFGLRAPASLASSELMEASAGTPCQICIPIIKMIIPASDFHFT